MVTQDRVETNLLQLFVHPKTSAWFSGISVNVFEVYVVSEQKQAYCGKFFCFYTSFNCPQLFHCPPCPIAVPASLLVLLIYEQDNPLS